MVDPIPPSPVATGCALCAFAKKHAVVLILGAAIAFVVWRKFNPDKK